MDTALKPAECLDWLRIGSFFVKADGFCTRGAISAVQSADCAIATTADLVMEMEREGRFVYGSFCTSTLLLTSPTYYFNCPTF